MKKRRYTFQNLIFIQIPGPSFSSYLYLNHTLAHFYQSIINQLFIQIRRCVNKMMKFEENTNTRQQTGCDTGEPRTSLSHVSSDQVTMEGTKQYGFYLKNKHDSRKQTGKKLDGNSNTNDGDENEAGQRSIINQAATSADQNSNKNEFKGRPTATKASNHIQTVIKNQTLQKKLPQQNNRQIYQTLERSSVAEKISGQHNDENNSQVQEGRASKLKSHGSEMIGTIGIVEGVGTHFSDAGTLMNESAKLATQSSLQFQGNQTTVTATNDEPKVIQINQTSRSKFKGIFPPKKQQGFNGAGGGIGGSSFKTAANSTPQNLLNMQKRIDQARRKKGDQRGAKPQSHIPYFKKTQLDLEREKITNFFSKQQEEQEDYQSKLTTPNLQQMPMPPLTTIQHQLLQQQKLTENQASYPQKVAQISGQRKSQKTKQLVEVVMTTTGQQPDDFTSPNKDIQTDQIKPTNNRFNMSKDQLEIANPVSLFDKGSSREGGNINSGQNQKDHKMPVTNQGHQNNNGNALQEGNSFQGGLNNWQQQIWQERGSEVPVWGLEIERSTNDDPSLISKGQTGGLIGAHSNTNHERQSQGGFSQYRSSINSNPDTSEMNSSVQAQPQRIQIRQSRESGQSKATKTSSSRRAFKNLLLGKRRQTPGYRETPPSKNSLSAARIQSVLIKQTPPRLQQQYSTTLNSQGDVDNGNRHQRQHQQMGRRSINYDSLNSESNAYNFQKSILQQKQHRISGIVKNDESESQQKLLIDNENRQGSLLSSLETEAYERDFDESQTKIFMAIKMQQEEQSRQIVNDILIPLSTEAHTHSQDSLQQIYRDKFTVHGKLSQLIQKHGGLNKQYRSSNPRLAPLHHLNYGSAEDQQTSQNHQLISSQLQNNNTMMQHDCFACSTETNDFMSKKTASVFNFKQQDRLESLENDRKTVNDVLAHFSSSKATIKRTLLEGAGDERANSLANFRNTRQLLNDMSIDYQDFNTTNKQRLQAMKASACLKRKTQFYSVPRTRGVAAQKSLNYQLRKKHDNIIPQQKQPSANNALGAIVPTRIASKQGSQRRSQNNDFVNQQSHTMNLDRKQSYSSHSNQQNNLQKQQRGTAATNSLAQKSSGGRFEEFKAKIKKEQEEINYVSDSQKSADSAQNQIMDYNRDNDLLALKKAFKQQKSGVVSLLEVIRKNAEKRSNDQRDHLVAHLMFRVPFFEDYSKELLGPTCEHLEGVEFKAGDTLIEQEDVGDTMYIIFGGECGEYYFPHNYRGSNFEQALNQQPNAILGANDVVGEKAVIDPNDQGLRQSTVVAHTDVVALELRKKDYQSVLYQFNLMERNRRFDFLAKLDFFKQMDRVSLIDFNSASEQIKVSQGDTLYDIGQMPNSFYVVREGKLIMETIIEVDTYFKFPVNRHKWEIRKQTKKTCYKLQDLTKGACFGHEEILQGFNRRCRVRALTKATLVCTNHEEMTRTMPGEQIDYLKKTMRSLDLDHIVKKIERYKTERMKRNQAVLDATSINAHDFSGDRFSFNELQNQSKIDKLLPWLNKARQNTTENLNLIHELNKVKILSASIERIILEKGDEDALLNEDLTSKTEARFVLPDPKETTTLSGESKMAGDQAKKRRDFKQATLISKKDSTTVGSHTGMSPLKLGNTNNLLDSSANKIGGLQKLSHSRHSSILQSRQNNEDPPKINRQMTLIERMKRNEINSMQASSQEDPGKITNFNENS